jgi:hypothetical protein
MVMVKTRKIMRRKIPVFRVHVGPGADYAQLKEIHRKIMMVTGELDKLQFCLTKLNTRCS